MKSVLWNGRQLYTKEKIRNGHGPGIADGIRIGEIDFQDQIFRLQLHEWTGTRQTHKGNRVLVQGAATFSESGMVLDGTTGRANFYADFGGLTGALTLEAWVSINSAGGGGYGRVIASNKLITFISATGKVSFESDGSTVANSAADIVLDGRWYRIAVSRTAAGVATFFIGTPTMPMAVSDGGDSDSGTPVVGTVPYIGNNSSGDRGMDGIIDEVVLYSTVRTLAQVERNRLSTVSTGRYS
jgi:hypothetical protein